ncbi:MAG: exo-alpha-sialidase [Candidatus Hinthialibacter antarcticus]|nr:exo-alpha-sialidase [Candidatus Hinthialibacter antarcticus]
MKQTFFITLLVGSFAILGYAKPIHHSQIIFPHQDKHVHGSSLVELPNGDLLAAWFQGSGERSANDVVINGARLQKGSTKWSDIFLMADTPNLPDCNPVLYLDPSKTLRLFWIAVRANGWQHSLLRVRTSNDYNTNAAPNWNWQDVILLQPGEQFAQAIQQGFKELDPPEDMWADYAPPYTRLVEEAAQDKNKRQEGWMTRNHPTQLKSGRILLPLYSDGFNMGLAAISDDGGNTWRASKPIVGLAGIQPTFAQRENGDIVAYMRDTGRPPNRVMQSLSKDDGETWSVMVDTDIPNPSSSLQIRALQQNDYWIMVHNDTEDNRGSMAVALSNDEGETWKWSQNIGRTESYGYPSLIEDKNGLIHISYTYKTSEGNTIKHETFSVEWIKSQSE